MKTLEVTYPWYDEQHRRWVFSDGSSKGDMDLAQSVGSDPLSPESGAYLAQMSIDPSVAVRPPWRGCKVSTKLVAETYRDEGVDFEETITSYAKEREFAARLATVIGGGRLAAAVGTSYAGYQFRPTPGAIYHIDVDEPRRFRCGYCRRDNPAEHETCAGCGAPQ